MKSFDYIIKDDLGLHARPASGLVKEAKNYRSNITIRCGQKTADAGKLLAVMGLGGIKGAMLTVQAEGQDEDIAIKGLEKFFAQNL